MISTVTPKELLDRMNRDEVWILDVRAETAYRDWHIDHANAKTLNIQTSKLKENGPQAYPEIPQNTEIVTVCAKGVASQEAAELLRDAGYQAVSLDRGMDAWSELYHPVTVTKSDELELIQVIRPGKGCLSYVLVSGDEAIAVDVGRHIHEYLDLAKEKGVTLRHVLDTHCHADHVSGGPTLAKAAGAKYWISAGEMQGHQAILFSPLTDGLKFQFGTSTLEVVAIPTPGHTPGSTSFLVNDKYLLSGDTVFVSGLGRPDLGGKAEAWGKLLYETVSNKLSALPADVVVLPAHFSSAAEVNENGYVGATLASIRQNNPLLQGVTEETFTDAITAQASATPPNYETIVQINLGLARKGVAEVQELEVGPNRCAAKHVG